MFAWLGARKRAVASAGILTTSAIAVTTFAVLYDGFPTTDVELNDGSVWITKSSQLLVGRFNHASGTLDAGLRALGSEYDIIQSGRNVLVVDTSNGVLSPVDPATVSLAGEGSLPPGGRVAIGGDTVAILQPDSGSVWVTPAADVQGFTPAAVEPAATVGEGAAVAVASDGTVFAAAPAEGAVYTIRQDADGSVSSSSAGVDGLEEDDAVQIAAAGTAPVLLNTSKSTLWSPAAGTREAPGAADGTLQQSSPEATTATYATPAGLMTVPTDGGDFVESAAGGEGTAAAPVSLKGCLYGAWSGSGRFIRDCAGEENDLGRDIEGVSTSAKLTFRVNRDVVVLNDTVGGTAWLAAEDLDRVDDWSAITPPDTGETNEENETELSEETSLPERTEVNHPPVAQDDDFGVRPGRTTVLPVLDNDNDPDGDVLTASAPTDTAIGDISPIYGGRALQINVPDGATGSINFTYEANDGRPGGTDEAVVSLSVHDWSVNSAPEQKKIPTVTVEQSGRITYNALLDWIDPDGDDLFLQAASAENGNEVDFTSDGQLTFRATGAVQGRSAVTIVVSDGQSEATGVVNVDVRPLGSTKPVPTPDHVVLRVGESTTVEPLENDVSPSGAPLRLARVTEVGGASVVPDYASGTFTFVSQTPNTYYVQYLATDGGNQANGIVRVDVLEAANPDDPPIAVRDTALLPGGKEVKVDVLANDSDPAGGILVVQSVQLPPGSRVSVSVVDHRYLLVTDQGGLEQPLTINYKISNGRQSAVGDVVVIPVPPPSQLRPPVANDDTAVVRAGDIVTIPVLSNDYHPNGDLITVAPDLVETIADPADGTIFVSEDTLRFRAGDTPKTVYATYEVVDSLGQKDAGYVTIQILARDDENNSAPRARDLTARVVAGSTARIPVPLDGIDPDGDSVQLLGIASAPTKGRVIQGGANWLEYEAFEDSAGLDEFTYQVQDRLGRTAIATVRVGVAPPDEINQAPFAVTDSVIVRPDRRIAVPVLENDSDPEGSQVTLIDDLEVPDGVGTATVSGDRVLVETGSEPGTYTIQYRIRDDRGATAEGALVVEISPDVPLLPPIARDDRITVAEVGDRTSIPVAVLENDEDPDGVKSELRVEVDDPEVRVGADGVVTVPITSEPQIIDYTVTDGDDLTARAFILVPGTADLRPTLRSTGAIEVLSGETIEIALADHVVVAGGGEAIITEVAKVSAAHSNGAPLVLDASTLEYTSADRYFGQDAITFEVTDGTSPEDPTGRKAVLTIPITVLPPENQAPEMTNAAVSIAPGEDATALALMSLVDDPDPEDAGTHTFRLLSSAPDGMSASVDGDSLSVSAPSSTPKGTTAQLEVEARDPEGLTGTATVTVTVTASTRRLPVAVDDIVLKAPQGRTQVVDVLANDDNPFPETPLDVVDLAVEAGEVAGTPQAVGGGVEVTPGADFVGSLVVRYTVQDATADPDRRVDGRIRLTVQGRPATPGTPTVTTVQDRTVVLSWTPPVNNGAEITHYTVRSVVGGYTRECPSTTCTLDGLTNNVEYNFTVTATNEVGESDASNPSATARPDTRPDTPQPPTLAFGDKQLTVTWVTPPTSGSPVESFNLEISPAPLSGSPQKSNVTANRTTGATNSLTWTGLENGTSYQVRVQAVNRAPEPSSWSVWSTSMIPAAPPGAPAQPTTERLSPVGNQAQLQVNWTEPALNGDPVAQYRITTYRGGAVVGAPLVVPGSQRSQAFNLDVSESAYTFAVEARNKAGWGAISPQSAARRAFTQPGAPTVTGASPANGRMDFTATAGAGNGASASELQYQYSINGGGWTNISPNRSGSSLSGSISGLNNGSTYSLRLRSYHTLDGTNPSPESNASAGVVPYGPPNTPGAGASLANDTTIRWSWSAPAKNGRDFRIEISIDGGGWENVGASSGSRNVGYGYSENHSIRVRVVDTEGQVSSIANASARTNDLQVRVWVSKGNSVTCESSGRPGCNNFQVNTQNFAGGSYRYQCYGSGRQFNSWEGPTNIPSNGSVQLQCHWGNPGTQVYVRLYNGPAGTVESERSTW